MSGDRDERCRDCRFWTNYGNLGTCQRHAPVMKLPQSHPERGIWPWTSPSDWCGDFRQRETSRP